MRNHLYRFLLTVAIMAAPGAFLCAQFTQLEDYCIGAQSGDVNRISRGALAGWLYFQIWDASAASRLYRTDGTAAAQAINNSLTSYIKGPSGSYMYFLGDNGSTGSEPWVTDGSSANTRKLVDVATGSAGCSSLGVGPAISGYSYFFAHTIKSSGSGNSEFLYKTNGTTAGTTLLKSWTTKSGSTFGGAMLDIGGGKGLFLAGVSTGTQGLWVTNGTKTGTTSIKTLTVMPIVTPVVLNGKYYFAGNNGSGMELWSSDGTSAGTVRLADLNPGTGSSSPNYLTVMDGKIYFTATTPNEGTELFVYTPGSGVALAADIVAGATSSTPLWLTAMGSKLYFNALTGDYGRELWVYDPTSGASLVKDIRAGSSGGDPRYGNNARTDYDLRFAVLGEYLYFAADDGSGFKLWRCNGTAAGTEMVPDFDALGITYPNSLTVIGTKLYFVAYTNSTVGHCLWVYTPPTPKTLAHEALPAGSALAPNFPNPFTAGTTLAYTLRSDARVRLVVTDMLGREVAVLADGEQSAGYHCVRFDAAALPAGMYLARFESGAVAETRVLQHLR